MHKIQKYTSFVVLASLYVLVILPAVYCLANEGAHAESSNRMHKSKFQKLSPRMASEVILHGFLLWASMGFLMPIGILLARVSDTEQCVRNPKVLFYFHVIIQIVAVLLTTAGAVLSIKHFENYFNNHHQRIGLGLYVIIWVQAVMGFFRPKRGSKPRSTWFFVHWLTGTGTTILGIVNIYTGLQAYHRKTSNSVKLWSILFTAEVCFFAFLYLLQDKWLYIRKQGEISRDEPTKPPNEAIRQNNNHHDIEMRPNQSFTAENDRFTF